METPEEIQAAKNNILGRFNSTTDLEQVICYKHIESFLAGIKWQKEQAKTYSKEEVIEFAKKHLYFWDEMRENNGSAFFETMEKEWIAEQNL